jgi:alanyl-tRNA synthetase
MDANGLRKAFTGYFAERGHAVVPSAGLIPHHPKAPLFTNAGMNQFLPYFLDEEVPPYKSATSVQKCVRIRGKHDDIELIGRTRRHHTFFEMLGNFSWGGYFKSEAIGFAWELLTDVLGLDPELLWVTVYETDDEAAEIWHREIGVPKERIQRGGEDNFWEMGDTGPCGPCSEIYYDRGPEFGEPGGPFGGGEERYVELWNLVFTQYDRQPDGSLADLPRKNIDTGAGLERILSVLQEVPSNWDTDVFQPIITEAAIATGKTYGDDPEVDVALRILADHGRSMTFLVNDGVFPSNEDRGYVLRRLIRRAVRQAFQLGVETVITDRLVKATSIVMGEAYPELLKNQDFIIGVVTREEQRFRATLRAGLAMLEEELAASGGGTIPGALAFKLHDTYGFPIELTREIAGERGVGVDEQGFAEAMQRQRQQSRKGDKGQAAAAVHLDAYRELVEQFGPTNFIGYTDEEGEGRVLAVLPVEQGKVEIFLDTSPFYAESGGQVGDTGFVETETGTAEVFDTTAALPGLHRHLAIITDGTITPGQMARARVDHQKRTATRRNHTGTHLLHWALREVLGDHVKQAGSLVAPDRLRFDFSHYNPLTPDEITRIEDLVNDRVLADEPVRTTEMAKADAERRGAIAFFGEKYGEKVRVVEAGDRSMEFCGGTHVSALGQIGPVKIISEGSIGANLRRIEATTGTATIQRLRHDEELLSQVATQLKAPPDEVADAVDRKLADLRSVEAELRTLRQQALRDRARQLAEAASADGFVVARQDGIDQKQLQELATNVRSEAGVQAVVVGGVPDDGKVALVAVLAKDSGLVARELIGDAARMVGGGAGGKNPEVAMAGGRDPSRLDEALGDVRQKLGLPDSSGK